MQERVHKFSSSIKFKSKYHLQLAVEFISTFILIQVVFLSEISVGGYSIKHGTSKTFANLAPMAVGFTVAPLIYTFGYLSGAHMNAAATFGFFLVKEISFEHAIGYAISQIAAAISSTSVAMFVSGVCDVDQAAPQISFDVHAERGMLRSFLSEGIYTFAMMTVVFHVGISIQKVNDFFGFAVALVVMSNIYAVGSVTGGCMNPSAATGLILMKCLCGATCTPMLNLWIYWAAPCLGSFGAALLFKMVHPKAVHLEKKVTAVQLPPSTPAVSSNINHDNYNYSNPNTPNFLHEATSNSIQHDGFRGATGNDNVIHVNSSQLAMPK